MHSSLKCPSLRNLLTRRYDGDFWEAKSDLNVVYDRLVTPSEALQQTYFESVAFLVKLDPAVWIEGQLNDISFNFAPEKTKLK